MILAHDMYVDGCSAVLQAVRCYALTRCIELHVRSEKNPHSMPHMASFLAAAASAIAFTATCTQHITASVHNISQVCMTSSVLQCRRYYLSGIRTLAACCISCNHTACYYDIERQHACMLLRSM
jgi:hypothetical protein